MPGVGVSYMEERGVLLVERQYRLGPGESNQADCQLKSPPVSLEGIHETPSEHSRRS